MVARVRAHWSLRAVSSGCLVRLLVMVFQAYGSYFYLAISFRDPFSRRTKSLSGV